MPFLRAAQFQRDLNALRSSAEGVGSDDYQETIKDAILEMQHMNDLLRSIELALSGF